MEKFRVEFNGEDTDVLAPDGGVAVIRHNGEMMLTDYYQEKIDPSWDEDDKWDLLAEGKMYCKEWPGEDEITDEIIDDAIGWLGFDPSNVEIERINA